jgi:biotin transport system substrate-specific component
MQNSLVMRIAGRLTEKNTFLVNITLAVIGSLFVALMAQITIYLPFSPVPITGQTFAVLLIGMSYGSRLGSITILTYLLEGVSGMPFFAGGLAGPSVLVGPSGGYLLGFVVAAWVVGRFVERHTVMKPITTFFIFVVGSVVIYTFGVIWLSISLGLHKAIAVGVLPFLPGDLIKALLASLGLPSAWVLVQRFSK